ncbi:MAG: hypothetical protein PHN59_07105 [Candidatus Omnitrophica bacterium]|nr:hypothetical protein [Candidatus Omnitrophota bacterium]
MCGGIAFKINKISKKELARYYSEKEIEKINKTGEAQSFFWSKKPVLPVEKDRKVGLVDWGNRDKEIDLPKTGWAKQESINDGKWQYLNPEFVKIPIERGFEKGVWFEPKSKNFQGLMVAQDKIKKVYMITKTASPNYLKLTKHNREPVEI